MMLFSGRSIFRPKKLIIKDKEKSDEFQKLVIPKMADIFGADYLEILRIESLELLDRYVENIHKAVENDNPELLFSCAKAIKKECEEVCQKIQPIIDIIEKKNKLFKEAYEFEFEERKP